MRIHIQGGRLIDPANGVDAKHDLFIADGVVAAVGKAPAGFNAERVIDATGLVVCPGLVDLAARLREPGFEYKATLQSELAAAVAGGVTSLACPPDTDPPLDEPGLVEMLKHRARLMNLAHVYPVGALTQQLKGERLTEMAELTHAGCVGFSQADAPIVNTLVFYRALQYAATFGFAVWLRPDDAFLGTSGVAHDGEVASRLGLPPIPAVSEPLEVARTLALARDTGARVHFCRVSHADSLALIAAAKADGLPVTCDVSINHLHLSVTDIGYFDSNCRLTPPLRSLRDRDALRAGLKSGVIDALCSDHAPVDDDAKQLPFGEAQPGAVGLELLLPMTLKWAGIAGAPLSQAIARVTSAPARVLGIDAGRLSPGDPADVCVFDPAAAWRVTPAALKSQGRNTPFAGYEVLGQVRSTLVSGAVVHEA
ncbi:MAG TPA: dihydroorotase [Pelomicrobium sp.]|nr:dihydroorotase [Pelomicrobium sp.]